MKDKRLGKKIKESNPECPECGKGYMAQENIFNNVFECNNCGCMYLPEENK